MADGFVDPLRDQRLIGFNLNRGGPMFSQVMMRLPEHTVCKQQNGKSGVSQPRRPIDLVKIKLICECE